MKNVAVQYVRCWAYDHMKSVRVCAMRPYTECWGCTQPHKYLFVLRKKSDEPKPKC